MSSSKFSFGMATVVMLVVLRLTIGWHFLYEGVWKIAHPDKFSAEPFLANAKGPAAPLFQAMIPDLDERTRLAVETTVNPQPLLDVWTKLRSDAQARYPQEAGDAPTLDILFDHRDKLEKLLADNQANLIQTAEGVAARASEEPAEDATEAKADEALSGILDKIAALDAEYMEALETLSATNTKNAAVNPGHFPRTVPDPDDTFKAADLIEQTDAGALTVGAILIIDDTIPVEADQQSLRETLDTLANDYRLGKEQTHQARKLYFRYADAFRAYLADNQSDIEAHFGSRDRFEQRMAAGVNEANHEKKRLWDAEMALRAEAQGWTAELDGMADDYRAALWQELDGDQKARGKISEGIGFSDFLDFTITWSLTLIGLCLMLGFCTRLAALGGAAFLFSVVLSQLPWPTIYPPAPPVVGHSLLIDKNFVEMIALLVLVTLPVGRWGGLDFFLHHWFGRPVENYLSKKV